MQIQNENKSNNMASGDSTDEQLTALVKENTELKKLLISSLERITEEEHIGRVFHDFNNILSSSMGYASLALERADSTNDEKLGRFLENIERSGIRARDLVRDSLARRQRVRETAQSDLVRVLMQAYPDAIYQGPEQSVVFFSDTGLAYMLSLLGAHYQGRPLRIRLESLGDAETHCRSCSAEMRGQQVRVSCLFTARDAGNHDIDFALSQSMVDSNGGHLCESLVQEREFDVYLKALV